MKPRVSVIVTVYKRTEYLRAALDSVLAQGIDGLDILVVDDSGSSAARDIVGEFDHPCITYLSNTRNVGVVASLRRAVEHAQGDLLAILNDDDLWEPGFLAELVAILESDPGSAVAFCDHWVVDERGEIVGDLTETWSSAFGRRNLSEGRVPDPVHFAVVEQGLPIANGAVFRKASIDWSLMVPDVKGAYDYWIACLLASRRAQMRYVPRRLSRYRIHGAMETFGLQGRDELVYIYATILERRWFPQLDSYCRGQLEDALYASARSKFDRGLRREARRDFWASFVLRGRVKALAGAGASLLPAVATRRLQACIRPKQDLTVSGVTSALEAARRLFR